MISILERENPFAADSRIAQTHKIAAMLNDEAFGFLNVDGLSYLPTIMLAFAIFFGGKSLAVLNRFNNFETHTPLLQQVNRVLPRRLLS